eukprot:NODE_1783_length_1069_cov_75.346078_g1455_i0.p1 GENE.NODE_1783_length_1069_cov_75.346078_g1455_i0~~NODE_1783_length_1069_cov_75.346078_g1455_i0.p1  ORF type:complete len:217 (+),score=39.97 NODE_1783_length_1069_cov_75.346078_g1455_i0:306-956(+)
METKEMVNTLNNPPEELPSHLRLLTSSVLCYTKLHTPQPNTAFESALHLLGQGLPSLVPTFYQSVALTLLLEVLFWDTSHVRPPRQQTEPLIQQLLRQLRQISRRLPVAQPMYQLWRGRQLALHNRRQAVECWQGMVVCSGKWEMPFYTAHAKLFMGLYGSDVLSEGAKQSQLREARDMFDSMRVVHHKGTCVRNLPHNESPRTALLGDASSEDDL